MRIAAELAQQMPPYTQDEQDPLLTAKETAELIGMSASWLAKARKRGDGPRFVKFGKSVRYPRSCVREDVRGLTRSSTHD